MDAKQLRISNIFMYGDRIVTILEILTDYTRVSVNSEKEFISVGYNQIDPIPLTEEWLLKLGFNKFGGQLMLRRFTYDERQRRFEIEGFEYDFNGITASPQYVHQLQNLYFALTGEELTIKK